MKVNLENMHSPCQQCYIRGHSYSSDDNSCQRCEYNIAIELLKRILRIGSICSFCKHYNGCVAPTGECNYSIDWNKAFEVYREIKE